MDQFGWAVIGPGAIAQRFAQAVQHTEGAYLALVHSRDPHRARLFAQRWSINDRKEVRATDDLDAVLCDQSVQGVYIASPHAFHGATVERCLQAGKPVLCEKPLVPNLVQGERLIALARSQRVFLMEAVWTRFLPIYDVLRDWLHSGAIGTVHGMQSSFCFPLPFAPDHRCYDPAQAGGALLDVGIYNLTMTRWVLEQAYGACPPLEALHAHGVVGPTGVDHQVAATLMFPDGITSQFMCGFTSSADNSLRIIGEHGHITLPQRFWEATDAVLVRHDAPPQQVHRPFRVNGFEEEIEEAMRCIRAGAIESMVMPHAETLATLAWMDRIRAQIGVRYPFE